MTERERRLGLIDARTRESTAVHARLIDGKPVLPEWAGEPGSLDFVYRLPDAVAALDELQATVAFTLTAPDSAWAVKVAVQLKIGVRGWTAADALAQVRADQALMDAVAWPELRNSARNAAAIIDVLVRLPGEHPRYGDQLAAGG